MNARNQLYEMILEWENSPGPGELPSFHAQLDELLFHADTRFHEYEQFGEDGEYPQRLLGWMQQLANDGERRALFEVARRICFLDRKQTQALYREALRGPIARWLSSGFDISDWVAHDFYDKVIASLRSYAIFSITESFSALDFYSANSLDGGPRVYPLGENLDLAVTVAETRLRDKAGLVILEDFVGSGNQAMRVLDAVLPSAQIPALFVPLVVHPGGLEKLDRLASDHPSLTIDPVFVIEREGCVCSVSQTGEPESFAAIRAVVSATEARVMEVAGGAIPIPRNPFGFGGCGALLVSYRNSPNNTLALIHHQAPTWSALFRRVDHFYGSD